MAELGPARPANPPGELAAVLMMMATVLALYMPGHLRTLPLLPALVYIVLNRKAVTIESALRTWALLFVSWLVIFSLLADDMSTAWKGTYDILRGCLYFFTGYFFGTRLQADRHYPWLLLMLAAVLAGSFLFHQAPAVTDSHSAGFYGYHANPNNSAFVVVLVLAFVLPVLYPPRKPATGVVTGLAGIAMSLPLLYLANSRNAWLAVCLGLSALGIASLQGRRSLRMVTAAGGLVLLAVILLFFNRKGFSIPARIDTWTRLVEITLSEHPWLGHGINNTKAVLANAGSPVQTAHNLLVDVFVSTGIIGTLLFVALSAGLLLILAGNSYRVTTAFQIGLAGLVMFGTVSMFDLKFASITLMGAFAFFTGVMYSGSPRSGGEPAGTA